MFSVMCGVFYLVSMLFKLVLLKHMFKQHKCEQRRHGKELVLSFMCEQGSCDVSKCLYGASSLPNG